MTEPDGAARAGAEAARLLSAAQEWLRSSAPHLAPVDDEGATCPCPLCRAVAGVREADPDAVGRWVDSAVAAASAVLAQAGERLASPEAPPGAEDADDPDPWPAAATADTANTDGSDVSDDVEPTTGAAARQDEDRPRGVRRITLEQQEPGDLDG